MRWIWRRTGFADDVDARTNERQKENVRGKRKEEVIEDEKSSSREPNAEAAAAAAEEEEEEERPAKLPFAKKCGHKYGVLSPALLPCP